MAVPNMSVKKSDVVKAVIIRTRNSSIREDGSFISFSDNAVVIVNNDKIPRGTLWFIVYNLFYYLLFF